MAKMKAWREASRKNTVEGELTQRQMTAQVRQFKDKYPSGLLWGMLTRMGIVDEFYHANQEPNPTYPLSVQAHSFAGKVVYGVYSAYIHDFLANMDNYPTYVEAESVMHEYIAKTKEYGK